MSTWRPPWSAPGQFKLTLLPPTRASNSVMATLAMLATHSWVAAVTERTRHPAPSRLISLTCSEVQHLFAALLARPAGDLGHRLRWSLWRRRYQARARTQANGP
jgi:hypothetical protein